MSQRPLQFDPNRKENQIDSLSDTWSRADTLLEELPKARLRKDLTRADDESKIPKVRRESDARNPSRIDGAARESRDKTSRPTDRPRQGLLRRR